MSGRSRMFGLCLAMVLALTSAGAALAAGRDAAFMDPNLSTGGNRNASSDAVTVEPKSDIDTGESVINIARRVTLFFVNQTSVPVDVASVITSSDGNVKSELVADDCTKQGKIDPSSRCSVTVEITSSSSGPWTAEVQMTHSGAGRIARAKLSGKTSGQSGEKKDNGLALNTKDIKPVDFGEVSADGGMAVRSALMLNDSPEPITVLSIDVIAAENGLERLDQGCVPDEELRPGESCPVTMVWKPKGRGQISTDLIIRHTGRTGFTVIPLRGNAKGEDSGGKGGKNAEASSGGKASVKTASPLAGEVEKMVSNLPPLPESYLPSDVTEPPPAKKTEGEASFHLIGTVGNRAVILKPDGTTAVVDIGEDIAYGDGLIAKITNVMPKGAEIFIAGKKKQLILEASAALTAKARDKGAHVGDTAKGKGNAGASAQAASASASGQ